MEFLTNKGCLFSFISITLLFFYRYEKKHLLNFNSLVTRLVTGIPATGSEVIIYDYTMDGFQKVSLPFFIMNVTGLNKKY